MGFCLLEIDYISRVLLTQLTLVFTLVVGCWKLDVTKSNIKDLAVEIVSHNTTVKINKVSELGILL